jgi:subtilisin family serine protease
VLVRLARGASAAGVAGEHGLKLGHEIGRTGFRVVNTTGKRAEAARDALRGDRRVEAVELDYIRTAAAVPNDPQYAAEQQSYLATAGFERAWTVLKASSSQVIAVVDSGVDLDHPDLAGRLVTGTDVVGAGDSDPSDENGHGTMVAGIAGAVTNNGVGIAGASWGASIMPVRALDATGQGTDVDVAEGMAWAVDHGADVINLSLGAPGTTAVLDAAVDDAVTHGVVVVAAAGNEGVNFPFFPAADPDVIAVGATDDEGSFAYFSNYGPWVDIVAPGTNVRGTDNGGGYDEGPGTSFASPLVAAAAALVRTQNPSWTPAQVADRLKGTAQDRGYRGVDHVYGFGLLDASAAVRGTASPAVATPARDASEPNGYSLSGTVINHSQTKTGTISPEGDVDWYLLSNDASRTITITVTPPFDPDAPWTAMDPIVQVYSSGSEPTEIAYRDGTFTDQPEVVSFSAAAGTYRVKVSNYHGTVSPGSYTIATTAGGVPEPDNSDDRLWINSFGIADGSTVVTTGAVFQFSFPAPMTAASMTDPDNLVLVDGRTGLPVPVNRTVFSGNTSARLTPTAPLLHSRPYHLRATGLEDQNGDVMASTEQVYFVTEPPPPPPPVRSGYWMADRVGNVYNFGDAKHYGDLDGARGNVVDLEPTPTGNGYWVLTEIGEIFTFGDAKHAGQPAGGLAPGEIVTSMSANPKGAGYWLFTSRGRVMPFGGAAFYGDMTATVLNGPVLDSVSTPSGNGYYMVASDGGIFTFGDARFFGSMGGKPLNQPVQSLVPDGDNVGYWLVASDGGIFSFEAPFRGSMGSTPLNRPVTGMVRFGNGYLMVGEDGGIFNFSDKPFHGSLGSNPPPNPVVSVGGLDT